MKQCKQCGAEFAPKHETRGHEQLYCSIKCRTEAYKKRTLEKMQANENEKNENDTWPPNVQRSEYRINANGNIMPNVNLEILEGKYQAKTEALEYKLRYEQALKEIEEQKRKIVELEVALNEYEEEDEGEEESGYLGTIMNMAKNNPEIGNAIGKLLQNDKVQNFVISLMPNTQNQ